MVVGKREKSMGCALKEKNMEVIKGKTDPVSWRSTVCQEKKIKINK